MSYRDSHKRECRLFHSHGNGMWKINQFGKIGKNVIFEKNVYVFHPDHIEIGNNVYIGHGAYLKAYYKNTLVIGNNVWIGQEVFLHAGGGITIEDGVGIGPYVKILTLTHNEGEREVPILYLEQKYAPVHIEYGVDVGMAVTILPGVRIGQNSIVGAGAVVTKNIPSFSIAAGVPAKVIRRR